MTPLHSRILAQLGRGSDVVAIEPAEPGRSPITYARLASIVARLHRRLAKQDAAVGILSSQTPEAYVAVVSAFLSGVAFVPLNPKFPVDRLKSIASLGGVQLIMHDASTATLAGQLGSAALDVSGFVDASDVEAEPFAGSPRIGSGVSPESVAYKMFTSGSTGTPKGVPVSFANLSAYVDGVADLVKIRPGDRHSQTFDLSFDLSMHDIFVTLANGATIVQPSSMDMLMPGSYIQRRKIDVWFSVPFLAGVATSSIREDARGGRHIRLALFCGESLSVDCARRFQAFLAIDSETYNLYGPTEATIAFTGHRYSITADLGPNVPIGLPFGENQVALLDDGGKIRDAMPGVEGELLLAGPQVFSGYSPEVSDPFVHANGNRYYRSGDRVRCQGNGLYHLGRTDLQMKLRGYRIEAAEIEAACRNVLGLDQAVALIVGEGPQARLAVAYVADDAREQPDPAKLHSVLPRYMVPSNFRRLDVLPLNSNSKVDRKAIAQLLE